MHVLEINRVTQYITDHFLEIYQSHCNGDELASKIIEAMENFTPDIQNYLYFHDLINQHEKRNI